MDIVSFEDVSDPEGDFDGIQITVGYGWGVDLHIMETTTKQVGKQSSLGETANSSVSHLFAFGSSLSHAHTTATAY